MNQILGMDTRFTRKTTPAQRAWLLAILLLLFLAGLGAVPAVYAQSLSRAQPEDVGLSSERLERLSAVLDKYVEDGRLPGGVALVARRGKLAYLEAFGQRDREVGAPMRDDTIFRIASQTKALVSVGVMILQEEGRLLISDPVGKYLPEFKETTVAVPKEEGGYELVPAKRPITIRDLLTHTAGIGYSSLVAQERWSAAGITGWYFADRDELIGVTVSRMAALPFDAQPGERWLYGYATDILGALIERVSGRTLDEFLRARILMPLGMKDTHFYLPKSKRKRLATVYSATDSEGLKRAPALGSEVSQGAYVEGPRKSYSGGAGLLSTATDYARFLQMLLNGGELEGRRILSPKTVKLMTVAHVGEKKFTAGCRCGEGLGFGLGFYVVEELGARGTPGSVGEFGWDGAYHSTYWVDPEEELVVVYFTQVIPAGNLDDHDKLRALVYQALVE